MRARTLHCGLIGEYIGASRFPAAMEMLGQMAGTPLSCTLIDTGGAQDFDLRAETARRKAQGWTGLTITHPWKTMAAQMAGDGMDRAVAHLGASNLLRFGKAMTGFNTDYLGFMQAWPHVMGARPPGRVGIAGAGGVARAVVPALLQLGAKHLSIWDAQPGRAEDLAAISGPDVEAVGQAPPPKAVDGWVNATALGMGKDPHSAIPQGHITRSHWAFDAVYTPVMTPFLRHANAAGAQIMTGFDMFRFMALCSFQIYTGQTISAGDALPDLARLRPPDPKV